MLTSGAGTRLLESFSLLYLAKKLCQRAGSTLDSSAHETVFVADLLLAGLGGREQLRNVLIVANGDVRQCSV